MNSKQSKSNSDSIYSIPEEALGVLLVTDSEKEKDKAVDEYLEKLKKQQSKKGN